jgi:uncharacterized membrane protein YccC
MKRVYLILAIVGAAVPYYFFLQHFGNDGLALPAFTAAVFANPAASGFTSDLLLSSVVFWIFMFQAGEKRPKPWLFIAINLLIGLSCALPAYLYWREHSRV